MHKIDDADIMHTYFRLVKTLRRHDADYHIGVHDIYAQGNFLSVLASVGPTWHQRDRSVLVTS